MADTVIRVENLGKRYIIGHQQQEKYTALRDVLANKAKGLTQLFNPKSKIQNPKCEEFWALKNVSFEVKRGDRIGIIGRNGAGKSTLLKILSRITEPTTGRVQIKGRVASLLEVGTGFHPELTGRENIFLNGAVLGMTKQEIRRKFDEIVAFAEVERFLDTPVKRYSSGMYVRLAFAVAAHLEPEILVVDEVLAVGDAKFQQKCLGKMEDIATREGRTILFVSHNMGAIKALCQRGMVLSAGQVIGLGDTESAISKYFSEAETSLTDTGERVWNENDCPGKGEFRLLKIALVSEDGEVRAKFTPQESFNVEIVYQLIRPVEGLRIVIQLQKLTGEVAFSSTDHACRDATLLKPGTYVSICRIPGHLMNLSEYVVRGWAGVPGVRYFLKPMDLMKVSIEGIGNHGSTFSDYHRWPGVVCPKLDWQVLRRESYGYAEK